jgi:hypothetical protein
MDDSFAELLGEWNDLSELSDDDLQKSFGREETLWRRIRSFEGELTDQILAEGNYMHEHLWGVFKKNSRRELAPRRRVCVN